MVADNTFYDITAMTYVVTLDSRVVKDALLWYRKLSVGREIALGFCHPAQQ